MAQKKKRIKVSINITIDTLSSADEIERAIKRGVYRMLDTSPNYIAVPKDVKITGIHQYEIWHDDGINRDDDEGNLIPDETNDQYTKYLSLLTSK